MRLSGILKTTGFIIGCLSWVVIGLTLLGPQIGTMMFRPLMGPSQPLERLACPGRLGMNEKAEVVARFANRSGKPQNYEIEFEMWISDTSSARSLVPLGCSQNVPLANGEIGTARCMIGPIDRQVNVIVSAWAEGEDYLGTCELGCPNSYQSVCIVAPDLWSVLLRPDVLAINGAILIVGLILVGVGMAMWGGVGRAGRVVMGLFFALAVLGMAFFIGISYSHWLPAAILVVVLGKAALVGALWLRAHPAQSTQ